MTGEMSKADEKFIAAVRAMEKASWRTAAFVIINPAKPDAWGRVVINYPADGAGRLRAIAWAPEGFDPSFKTGRHHGSARGGGYDKASAALRGMPFLNLKTGKMDSIQDAGIGWQNELREAGYIVIQAV